MTDETLCFSCRKACRQRCSWTRNFEPVEGWTAEETHVGYRVISCPEYEEGLGLPREMDTEGALLLLQAAAKVMRDDYVIGRGFSGSIAKNRQSIEKWLKTENLLQLSDPDSVIRQLRGLARQHDQMMLKMLKV